jgi:hypothetical protein
MVFEHHGQFGELLQGQSVEEMAKFHLFLAKAHAKKAFVELMAGAPKPL